MIRDAVYPRRSFNPHTWSVIPAAIAGVIRSEPCTRQNLSYGGFRAVIRASGSQPFYLATQITRK